MIRWESSEVRRDGHFPSWLFYYQTSVPLNKFVCKLYNVGDVPLHLIPPYCGRADFFVAAQNLAFSPELCYNPIYQTS